MEAAVAALPRLYTYTLNRTNTPWPPEHKSALRGHWDKGLSCSLIAIELNREFGTVYSRNSVIGQVHRSNLTPRKSTMRLRSVGRPVGIKEKKPRRIRIRNEWDSPWRSLPRNVHIDAPVSLKIPITQTEKLQCRFIDGEDNLCCGHTVVPETSWCPFHYRMVFVRRSEIRRAA